MSESESLAPMTSPTWSKSVRIARLGLVDPAAVVVQRLSVLPSQIVVPGEKRRFVGDRHHAVVLLADPGDIAAVAAHAAGTLVGHVDLLPAQRERVVLVLQSRVELSQDRDRLLVGREQRGAVLVVGRVERRRQVVRRAELHRLVPVAGASEQLAADRPCLLLRGVRRLGLVLDVHVERARVEAGDRVLEKRIRRVDCLRRNAECRYAPGDHHCLDPGHRTSANPALIHTVPLRVPNGVQRLLGKCHAIEATAAIR